MFPGAGESLSFRKFNMTKKEREKISTFNLFRMKNYFDNHFVVKRVRFNWFRLAVSECDLALVTKK